MLGPRIAVLPENLIGWSGGRIGMNDSVDHASVQRYPARNRDVSSTG
jgi:hypothetical protein